MKKETSATPAAAAGDTEKRLAELKARFGDRPASGDTLIVDTNPNAVLKDPFKDIAARDARATQQELTSAHPVRFDQGTAEVARQAVSDAKQGTARQRGAEPATPDEHTLAQTATPKKQPWYKRIFGQG